MTYTYPCIEYVGPAYPDASAPASARTLASRVSDGIEVDLWSEPGRVWVDVTDTRTGEAFAVPSSTSSSANTRTICCSRVSRSRPSAR
jgi:hypothetical protein